MKPYGHSRRDKLECRFGCCTGKSGKSKNCRKVVDRSKRKTARQFDQNKMFTSLIEDELLNEMEFTQ